MSVTLNKGQSVSLAKTSPTKLSSVRMGLGWDAMKVRGFFGGYKEQAIDLDASCLVFDAAGNLIDQVWFNQLASTDDAIQHMGDNTTGAGDGDDESIVVALESLQLAAHTLVFVVSSYSGQSFSQIENAFCRLVDSRNEAELARFDLSGSGPHTAQVMAKLARSGDSWEMTAIGTKTDGRSIHDLVSAAAAAL